MHPNFLEFALFQCVNMQKGCACGTFLITTVANQRYLIFPEKPDPGFNFFAKNLPLKKKSTKRMSAKKGSSQIGGYKQNA